MKHVVYISTARDLLTDEQLMALLEKSRRNNTAVGVTGILLYHEGAIFQILEGDEPVIDILYDRIMEDSRHLNGLKMFEGYGDKRYFPDWSMGFRKLNLQEWSEMRGFINPNKIQDSVFNSADTTSELIRLLKSFMNANFQTRMIR